MSYAFATNFFKNLDTDVSTVETDFEDPLQHVTASHPNFTESSHQQECQLSSSRLPLLTLSNSFIPKVASSVCLQQSVSHPKTSTISASIDTHTFEEDTHLSLLHLQSPPYLNQLSQTLTTAEEKLLAQGCDLRTIHGMFY